eukprot:7864090-Karenia_brevis.AAC.1
MKGLLSCSDPEYGSPVGGVAAIAHHHIKIIKLQPNTSAFKDIMYNGRVQMIGICLPGDIVLNVVNLYAWTNGHTCGEAALRTNDLVEIVLAELKTHPEGPRIILGDLNADPDDVPVLQEQLDQ